MKIDFWQLSHDAPETVVALIAARVLAQGDRLLIVGEGADRRVAISQALWAAGEESFLANGEATGPQPDRQPILLSDECAPLNGANHVIFADGRYRESEGFERQFLLFDEDTKAEARRVWALLADGDDAERAFYRQEGGRWVKVA